MWFLFPERGLLSDWDGNGMEMSRPMSGWDAKMKANEQNYGIRLHLEDVWKVGRVPIACTRAYCLHQSEYESHSDSESGSHSTMKHMG